MTAPANDTAYMTRPGPVLGGSGTGALPTAADDESPATRNGTYRAQEARWEVMNDTYEGTDALRRQGEKYLPKNPKEHPDKYKRRLNRSRFFNMVEPTLHGLTGMVFRKPPTLDDTASPTMQALYENIDGQGTHGVVFLRELMERCLLLGHGGILVDAATAPDLQGRTPMKSDVAALKARPYWVAIQANQIVNFRVDTDANGSTYLGLLVIEECVKKAVGSFGEKEEKQYRVFQRKEAVVTWQLWVEKIVDGKVTYGRDSDGVISHVTEIPFAPLYAGRRLGWFHSKPPLYSLAETNLDHFSVQSDHRHSMHVASVPIMVRKGGKVAGAPVDAGVESGIDINDTPSSNIFYLEHKGIALGATRQELLDLQQRGVSHGLQILAAETRAAETAMAKKIDRAEQDSRLAVAARALQDCAEQALVYTGQMIGEDAADISINLDISGLTLDPQTLATYATMVANGDLTRRTMWTMMQEAGELPEDFDADEEEQALAEQALQARASNPAIPPNPNADPTKTHPADAPVAA